MKEMNFTFVRVIDPKTNFPLKPEEWLDKAADPKKAEWVVIENMKYKFSVWLHKKELAESLNYPDSMARAKEFAGEGSFLGTRIDWITIYNAVHTAKLNDVLAAIGGDPIERKWYWTEELDEDRRYWKTDENGQSYATVAWFYYGTSGFLYANDSRVNSYASRVVRALS